MTERVVKVYPKQEQLESIVKELNDSLIHIDYLFANENLSFIDRSSLSELRKELVGKIDRIKSLYESKA
ncbi:hypothetical protein GPS59_11460 [Acinetobacter haemolyticus]|uniref:hypothetical protein n=1 Tax=Acinetobacter haemolyticus TaxID=29430 RepID=UPI000B213B23|nr:hypothetical protein [Acinetobacter haemolyticus]NAR54600.1 hypothetical protein [Acinetobacter haemolyticus]NAR54608.1 hypothetical protein [Acinetobacter haemolyticus]QHI23051.1 hypothetical protein Ahae5227_09225 [Acinetobacter haemolyticus]QHI23060.1 hypothetical protein Ahae5227_09275 [Acinetobacter haemolyticus]QHI26226.1 hypothetical protein Ahae2126ch_08620 [Acinetobacter haemolyticus]